VSRNPHRHAKGIRRHGSGWETYIRVNGEWLGTVEAAEFELVAATDQERLALARGGYRLGDGPRQTRLEPHTHRKPP
jgi:hypothetical protein